jgi:uncharacterized protein with FMN-binding domain
MIRTTAVPRPVRTGAAIAGIAGIVALAGCTASTATAEDPAAPATSETPRASTGSASDSTTSTYADGTYTGEGSYSTPESVESITVTVTLAGDVVTEVEVIGQPQKAESKQYQSEFIGGISEIVVGQDIDSLSVSGVAGSSLTSSGFNQALEQIKAEAAA